MYTMQPGEDDELRSTRREALKKFGAVGGGTVLGSAGLATSAVEQASATTSSWTADAHDSWSYTMDVTDCDGYYPYKETVDGRASETVGLKKTDERDDGDDWVHYLELVSISVNEYERPPDDGSCYQPWNGNITRHGFEIAGLDGTNGITAYCCPSDTDNVRAGGWLDGDSVPPGYEIAETIAESVIGEFSIVASLTITALNIVEGIADDEDVYDDDSETGSEYMIYWDTGGTNKVANINYKNLGVYQPKTADYALVEVDSWHNSTQTPNDRSNDWRTSVTFQLFHDSDYY